MTATLTLTEGSGPPDTSVGSFTVALSDAVAGVCDSTGQRASFPATAPSDFASPVLLTVVDLNAGAPGFFDQGDQLELGFSEVIANGLAPTTLSLVSNGSNDTFVAPGVLNAATPLNGAYIADNSSPTATFSGSTVALKPGTPRTVLVTLAACGPNSGTCNRRTAGTSTSVIFTASPSLSDAAGRTATGTVTLSNFRMF